MKQTLLRDAERYASARRRRGRWYKTLVCLAAAVVFCTTYALILPAVTLEKTCPIPAHTHSEDCYTQVTLVTRSVPVCTEESLDIHVHDDSCRDESGALICGLADFVVHTHDASCYDGDGVLWCPLPEIEAHEHDESCYDGGHAHGPDCYAREQGELICTLEESEGHAHGEACYDDAGELICGQEEAEGHTHGDDCYTWSETLVCTEEERPAELVCGKEEIRLHTHDESCCDEAGELVCGQIQVLEHQHTDACFETVEEPVDTEALTCTLPEDENHTHGSLCYGTWELTCGMEEHEHGESCGDQTTGSELYLCGLQEHIHGDDCRNEAGELTCGLEEHLHEEACGTLLTVEERIRVMEVNARIAALPASEEVEAVLTAYEEADDWEGYEEYYEQVYLDVKSAYVYYEDLSPEAQALVTDADKLMEFQRMWSAATLAVTDTVKVYQVNKYSSSGATTLIWGGSSSEKGIGMLFSGWTAYIVEKNTAGQLYVDRIVSDNSNKNSLKATTTDGFVLLLFQTSVNASVGDLVYVSFNYQIAGYNSAGYGTVTFSSAAAQKNPKDNTDQLHVIPSASTRDFIELNLYDYGSGSTGKNINDKFNADKNMPGFQQNGGTSEIRSLELFKGTGYMNFGDTITSDLADGRLVTPSSENPQGINVVQDSANSPISRYSTVMKNTLLNGYPALVNGSSLGYLFGAEDYSKKMNTESVDGLFQYNEETGAYSFNSRENFAQFNADTNSFTLYKEIFTPNFIMYPFGNFMPFNDIVHDAKQVSQINRAYFNELYLQANYLYQQGKGDQYGRLAKALSDFLYWAEQDNWGSDWTAERALEHYFYWGSQNNGELPPPKDEDNNYKQILLSRLYSLDYDVPSDFYFGMEMKMNFMQPRGGLTGKDGQQPMVFYFTGDDDVWVYLDGVLFLDLSGIHRHVGGEIDFVNGEVKYYSLDTKTGDVSPTPYKTVKFSELVDAGQLNEKGTFQDYSTHSFNFYYMERGSGSSVCRMNFNFPLLRKNSISVTKELTVDDETQLPLLGNPDFRFQVLKADNSGPLIGENVSYDILNASGQRIGSGTTGTDGVFTLKAGQTAVFSNIAENAGQYYVRELLEPDAFSQYGKISVDGSTMTTNNDVTIGSDIFKGVDSPVKDMSSGSTVFHFNNEVTFNKLGRLEITKKLETYPKTRDAVQFSFYVTLDGEPLKTGTAYTVGSETRTVTEEGLITLAPDETAVIPGIIAGSRFTVRETTASAKGYTVTYSGEGLTQETDAAGSYVSGVIKTNAAVAVTVTNSERGTSVTIPGSKILTNPDGKEHTFSFTLQQVSGTDFTPIAGGTVQTASVTMTDSNSGSFGFELTYLEKELTDLPATFWYQITEDDDSTGTVQTDPTVWLAEVTVSKTETGELQAQLTSLQKDGKQQTGQTVTFTNTLLGSLTIEKQVSGGSTEEAFPFSVTLKQGESPLSGDFRAVKTAADSTTTEQSVTFVDGSAQIQLAHGERLMISGIPLGTVWSVTEDTGGYKVSWTVGEETISGSSCGGTLNGDSALLCLNKFLYELPQTGGSGICWYYAGGLGLMLGAGALLLVKAFSRRRGEDSS